MSFLFFAIIFILALTGDFLNALLLNPVRIQFLLLFPLSVLLMRKDWVSCVVVTLFGLVIDSYSTGFFGIHGFAFFLTSLLVIWASEKLADTLPMLFLTGFLASLAVYLISSLLVLIAEGQDFLSSGYKVVLFLNILPSAVAFMPVFLLCRKLKAKLQV